MARNDPPPLSAGPEAFARWLEGESWANFHDSLQKPKLNGNHGAKAEAKPVTTIQVSSWDGQDIPQQYFFDERRLIPMGYATIFTGPGGVGKTLLALQASVACATGTPWLNGSVKHGPVLFLSAEDPLDVLHMRIDGYCRMKGIHLSALADFHIVDLSNVLDSTIIKGDARTSVASATDFYRQLDVTLAVVKPKILWLDNRSLLISGNESDRTIASMAMRLLQLLADKHGCAVVLLSHPSLAGIISGTGSSGSTAWVNTARSVINMTKSEDDDDCRVLENNKANYSKTGTRVNVKWMGGYFECTDPPIEATPVLGTDSKAERVFMKLLRWHIERGMKVTKASAAKEFDKLSAGQREGVNMKWFEKAMFSLLDRHMIRVVIGSKNGHMTELLEIV